MFNLFEEDVVSLTDACEALPGRPHVSTLWRWATHGVGPERTRLETVSVGGRRYTSKQALQRFVVVRSGLDQGSHSGLAAGCQKAAAEAQKELERKLRVRQALARPQ